MVSDLGKQSALVNTAKGISPFAMIYLLKEDIAVMKYYYEELQRAMAVSAT